MELVHLQIHPSLQTGFGLQTKMNMGLDKWTWIDKLMT